MKICIWTIYPNHYQAAFHEALRAAGVDVRVCYFGTYCPNRVALGWTWPSVLPEGEYYADSLEQARVKIPDFSERIQVNTGFYSAIYWKVLRAARQNGLKWVHWSEASSKRWRSLLLRKRYGAHVRSGALGAFAIGNMAARDFLSWGIPPSKIEYLPYTTPPVSFAAVKADREPGGRKGTTFVFCGTLCERKAVDLILSAFYSVWLGHPDVRLILIGNKALSRRTERQLRETLGRCSAIQYKGAIAPQHFDAELAQGDVCLLPSRFDGWGLALAEGARNGLALIGSDRCGASEHLIVPDKSGIIVKAGDVESLKEAMRRYADAPHLAGRHGVEARRLVADTAGEVNAKRFVRAVERWRSSN